MKIILYVDFSSKQFNKDFDLSNALLREHTVLLVINNEQLYNAYTSYDILLYGNSIETYEHFVGIESYSIAGMTIDEISNLLKK